MPNTENAYWDDSLLSSGAYAKQPEQQSDGDEAVALPVIGPLGLPVIGPLGLPIIGPVGVKLRRTGRGMPEQSGGRRNVAMGWHVDEPDFRDQTLKSDAVVKVLKESKSSLLKSSQALPARHNSNLRYCSPVEDQGTLGTCTANAVVGMLEYLQRRAGVDYVDGSRLFLYKVTRRLLGWEGDTGAFIRTSMQAAAAFGVPPESTFPYVIGDFEKEPEAFHYAYAANYKTLNYARLDYHGISATDLLHSIKRVIYAGHVVPFGFTVYSSLSNSADIPYPDEQDSREGGHAVLIVGYDDTRPMPNAQKTGALLIRNSWGMSWGDGGYGWLPFDYVLDGLARDFWVCFKADWIATEQFMNS